jgi:hypothetical protein
MPRARLRIALAVSLMLLVVVGAGSATAGPFASGPLVQVSGASPIAACDGDDGNVGAPSSSTARSSRTSSWIPRTPPC